MVRPQRIEYEDACYHVMNRGRGRHLIYHDPAYYELFLECLAQAHQRFSIEIQAYCLMGNHYHLLIKTPRGNLSRAMRHINGVYTQKYNQLKNTDGSLFRGRYKAILIDTSSYLLEVSRYIHRNPVELKQPLVAELIDYQWSSYPAYIKKAPIPTWLETQDIYGELGVKHPIPAYQRYIERGLDQETKDFYNRNQWPTIRGDKEFTTFADAHAINQGIEVRKSSYEELPLKTIVAAVAAHYQCKTAPILKAKRGRGQKNHPRWMAMKLCQDLSGETLKTIADYFGVKSYATVSITITRLKKELEANRTLVDDYNSISIDLTP